MPPLAITGATGHLGGRVARRLAAADVPQRLVVRDPARAPAMPNAVVVRAAYHETGAASRALQGADTVVMVSGSEHPDRVAHHQTFVDAAVEVGVRRLVYVSFLNAAPDATFTLARDHWATEEHIRRSGLAFTFLRDNLYLDFLPMLVGVDGVIRGPAGTGAVAAVARNDVADVAAAILQRPGPHEGVAYDLTGPEALTLAEVAATLSRATGRAISYHRETVSEAYASRARYGAPGWQVDAWVSTYTAIAAGEMATVSDVVERIAGHAATSLDNLLRP